MTKDESTERCVCVCVCVIELGLEGRRGGGGSELQSLTTSKPGCGESIVCSAGVCVCEQSDHRASQRSTERHAEMVSLSPVWGGQTGRKGLDCTQQKKHNSR